jgi:hypothetical protein
MKLVGMLSHIVHGGTAYLQNGTINARQKKKTILNSLNDRVVYYLCNDMEQTVDLLEYALNKELFVP